jgi:hypothetical protein
MGDILDAREEHALRVLENKLMTIIFRQKNCDKWTGDNDILPLFGR